MSAAGIQRARTRQPLPTECEIAGCSRKPIAKSKCKLHYYRVRDRGTAGSADLERKVVTRDLTLQERLAKGTNRSAGPDACWPWMGTRNRQGYGDLTFHGKRSSTHRWAWVAARGPIPDGLVVRHRCDNPPCCNPNHLEIGTAADNMQDRKVRGRAPDLRGEKGPGAKFTAAQIRAMREAAADGVSRRHIREQYGISPSHLDGVINRRYWKDEA